MPELLFPTAGSTYVAFRVPAAVRAGPWLLAFAEGRRHAVGDTGEIDLVLRRSADGGRTWGPLPAGRNGGSGSSAVPMPGRPGRNRNDDHRVGLLYEAGTSDDLRQLWFVVIDLSDRSSAESG